MGVCNFKIILRLAKCSVGVFPNLGEPTVGFNYMNRISTMKYSR